MLHIPILKKIFIVLFFIAFMLGCTEHDVALYTLKGELVYTYLQKDTTYSEYLKVIDRAGLKGLLSTYREYTCFAPTNTAMRKYYHSLGSHFTIDSLRTGQIDTLARIHILPNRHNTSDLTNGILSDYNINYQFVEVKFDTIAGGILLNGSSRIISKDNDVNNGVVHGIDKVFDQPMAQLPNLMTQNKDISIFTQALFLTHLSDSLMPVKEVSSHVPKAYYMYDYSGNLMQGFYSSQYRNNYSPFRKYGFTAFVEDNALLASNGVHNLNDLIKQATILYPCDTKYATDYSNPNNSLNQYIAYHLIKKTIYNNRFFYSRNAIQNYIPDEFLETMLSNRIIRVSNINTWVTLNPETDYQAHVMEGYNQRTENGAYYRLDHLLAYTDGVEQMLKTTRIRFDMASLIPELANNNIRGTNVVPFGNFTDPVFDFDPGYLSNIKTGDNTHLLFYTGRVDGSKSYHGSFQADIFRLLGFVDVTIRLLPVPPGTYEIRVGLGGALFNNIVQIYVDNHPEGLPLDLSRILQIGWLSDNQTDDDGVKNDQLLRYKEWMKGPTTYWGANGQVPLVARDHPISLRRIIGTFSFSDYQAHTIRFKSVLNYNSELWLDYFELVPKAVFAPPGGEYESRD